MLSKHYRVNYQITSPTVRLLDESGKQVGIVSKIEALQKAREFELDVVEIGPKAQPPVAKLIDYKKFKYQEAKKERDNKKNTKNVTLKEVRLRPFIGDHDLETRRKQTIDWLNGGNQVKINVVLKGRELTKKEFGSQVLSKFLNRLEQIKVVREAHWEGKVLSATVIQTK